MEWIDGVEFCYGVELCGVDDYEGSFVGILRLLFV